MGGDDAARRRPLGPHAQLQHTPLLTTPAATAQQAGARQRRRVNVGVEGETPLQLREVDMT
jgi:hypothetical protein